MTHERTNETLAFLSGDQIKALPEPTRPEPGIDWHAVARSLQLSGSHEIRRTMRGSWEPLADPPDDVLDWSEEVLRRRGEA